MPEMMRLQDWHGKMEVEDKIVSGEITVEQYTEE